jgi:hypothetical protein
MKRSAQPLHGGSPAQAGLSSIPSHLIAPWKWPEVYWGPQSCLSEIPRARSLSTRRWTRHLPELHDGGVNVGDDEDHLEEHAQRHARVGAGTDDVVGSSSTGRRERAPLGSR